MIWDVIVNKMEIESEKKTPRKRWYKRKQTNNNSSNSARMMLVETDYRAGRRLYISVWSTTTSDQSEPMGKINKPYGNRRYDVVDTL